MLCYLEYRFFSADGGAAAIPVGPTGKQPELTPEERQAEKTRRIQFWLSQPTVLLQSPDLEMAVDAVLRSDDCISVPRIGQLLQLNDLKDAQKTDLKVAITGILRAYGSNDPDTIYDYRISRKEHLSEEMARFIKGRMLEQGLSSQNSETPKALFSLCWKKLQKCRTHLKSLVTNSGCAAIWKLTVPIPPNLTVNFGQEDNVVFGDHVGHRPYCFTADSATPESCLDRDGLILMADVKVVLQYDEDRLNEPRPHYFRFWYDTANQRWHLHDLVLIPAFNGTAYPSFML
jgi:hypothetical protein